MEHLEFLRAAEMYEHGSVSQLVAPGELAPAARSLALSMAGKSPLALRMAKGDEPRRASPA